MENVMFKVLILVAQTATNKKLRGFSLQANYTDRAICVNIHDAAIGLVTSFKQGVSLLALIITVNTVYNLLLRLLGCV
jgi:hypothetical protein